MAEKKSGFSIRKLLFGVLAFLILALVIAYFICGITYSEGNRAGVLIKFSKKGLAFKTYEGELNMGGIGNIPNTAQMNQVWDFSVIDGPTADSLMQLEGRKVSLHYRQVLKNMFWQGETEYFVDGAKVINQ
jgi:hypothetical protein